jgi:hypothetical protein
MGPSRQAVSGGCHGRIERAVWIACRLGPYWLRGSKEPRGKRRRRSHTQVSPVHGHWFYQSRPVAYTVQFGFGRSRAGPDAIVPRLCPQQNHFTSARLRLRIANPASRSPVRARTSRSDIAPTNPERRKSTIRTPDKIRDGAGPVRADFDRDPETIPTHTRFRSGLAAANGGLSSVTRLSIMVSSLQSGFFRSARMFTLPLSVYNSRFSATFPERYRSVMFRKALREAHAPLGIEINQGGVRCGRTAGEAVAP